jgi:sugar/nucleoside kinase (ribokinase family)
MKDGDMESAVTTSMIERVSLDFNLIDDAIKNVEMVILDCNLSVTQINKISRICKKNNKALAVSGVSEAKVNRASAVYEDGTCLHAIDVLSMNDKEAVRFFSDENYHKKDPGDLCTMAKASNIVVSNGLNGYTIFNRNNKKTFPSPKCEDIKTTAGAGDALMAAICSVYDGSNSFIEKNREIIEDAILMSLQIMFPTNDAELGDREREHIEKRQEKIKKTDIINTALTIVIAFGTIIVTYVALK